MVIESMPAPASILDGMKKPKARNHLQKVLLPLIKGLYRDDAWRGATKVWNALNEMNANWSISDSKYRQDKDSGLNVSKLWNFEVEFLDDKGKVQKILGALTAHGAGSVKDPLDAYDMTMSIY